MCIDHYLASTYNQDSPTVLRFYGWMPFCISLGYHQPAGIVNIRHLNKCNYDLVRRPTGGRAILHAHELTYSVIAPIDFMPPRDLYAYIHTILAQALQSLDFAVSLEQVNTRLPSPRAGAGDFPCFTHSAYSEIQFQGKKVVGSAQRIYPKCTLQHGSILIGDQHEQLAGFISKSPREKNRILNEIKNRTCTLDRIGKHETKIEQIILSIIKQIGLSPNIFLNFDDLTAEEMEAAQAYRIAI